MLRLVGVAAFALIAVAVPSRAGEFSFSFEWGAIPLCTNGSPGTVASPRFSLQDVPAGTVEIRFTLKDLDRPSFNHGGGKVKYAGEAVIEPGAFKYTSPCPPDGSHTYRWTASARGADGSELADAQSKQKYP